MGHNDKAMPSWANKDYKIVKQLTLNKMEENKTKHEPDQLGIAGVSHSDFLSYCELVLSYLKDRKCVSVPTRAAMLVASNIEQKGVSFSFINESKSEWTVFHCLYCHCG